MAIQLKSSTKEYKVKVLLNHLIFYIALTYPFKQGVKNNFQNKKWKPL